MAIKPILFNTEMVRAIFGGRKTVTRRVIKPQPDYFLNYFFGKPRVLEDGRYGAAIGGVDIYMSPTCEKGDILYVRETWCKGSLDYKEEQYFYKADDVKFPCKWKPSIHMPKEAARIFLKVTDVRVELLQEMTNDDAIKEGEEGVICNHPNPDIFGCTDCMNTGFLEPPIVDFMYMWNSTIKKSELSIYGWDANPYVWVIEFDRCEKPEGF